VDGHYVEAVEFWARKPSVPIEAASFGHTRSMDIRNIFDALEKSEDRLKAIGQEVIEEIHAAIGSVQVEDAKTMKR
jgi:hypothetical protein